MDFKYQLCPLRVKYFSAVFASKYMFALQYRNPNNNYNGNKEQKYTHDNQIIHIYNSTSYSISTIFILYLKLPIICNKIKKDIKSNDFFHIFMSLLLIQILQNLPSMNLIFTFIIIFERLNLQMLLLL